MIDSLYAARRGEVLRDERGQFALQDLLHLSYDVRRRAIHRRDALRDLRLLVGRQRSHEDRRLIGVEIRHDQGDRLRMLVLNEIHELARICLVQEVERTRLQARRQAIENELRLLHAKRLLQDVLRVFESAGRQIALRHEHLVEFGDDRFLLFGRHLLLIRDLQRYGLDFFLVHMLEEERRTFSAERDEEDCRLLSPRQGRILLFSHINHPPPATA